MEFATKESCKAEMERLNQEIKSMNKKIDELESICKDSDDTNSKMENVKKTMLSIAERISEKNPTLNVIRFYRRTIEDVIVGQDYYNAAESATDSKREINREILAHEEQRDRLLEQYLECERKLEQFNCTRITEDTRC